MLEIDKDHSMDGESKNVEAVRNRAGQYPLVVYLRKNKIVTSYFGFVEA